MNVIEYFDRVQIVNMAIREDRRRETEDEFAANSFPINTDSVGFFEAITPEEADEFPNRGAKGCFMSHLTILQDAEARGLNNVLLLEDDLSFSKHVVEYTEVALGALKDMDWDIVYFGHAIKNDPDTTEWKEVTGRMLTSHFYAVNGKTISRLTEFLKQMSERPCGHPEGGPMHYDGALSTFMSQNDDIKGYYFSKNLGYQRPSKTNIHEPSAVDTNIFLKPLIGMYRKFKQFYLRRVQ